LDLAKPFEGICLIVIDAPLDSLMDSIASPKVKTMEGERVGVRFLVRNILGVKWCAKALG
jgi:hypothetical protein